MTKVRIIWSNQGGPLDTEVIEFDERAEGTPIMDKLNEMVAGCDLDAGDTITIEAAE